MPTLVFIAIILCTIRSLGFPNGSPTFNLNNELEGCICVPQALCQDNDVSATGTGYLDIRFEQRRVCANYFEICCENPQKQHEQQQQHHHEPSLPAKEIFTPILRGCGYKNPTGLGYRITGDDSQTASFAEFPWTVVVLHSDHANAERRVYRCGGSLIHYQVVMTAAHCVSSEIEGQLLIRAGEWDMRNQEELLPHQDRMAQEILVHEQYDSGSLKNDIALLFLDKPIEDAENVACICLPPPDTQMDQSRCTASGWGKNAFKKGKHSSVLKKVELPIVPTDSCMQALRTTRLGKFYNLHNSFICAGGENNRDTCRGDGGSPLVCPISSTPGRFVQMGIVSWGIGCGNNNIPGVYVNVALYRDWIDEQLIARNFDINVYRYD